MEKGKYTLRHLVEQRFGLENVGYLVHQLRCLGLCTRDLIRYNVPCMSAKHQFIAACILSYREIESSSDGVITNAMNFLQYVRSQNASVSFERAVVLMNHPHTRVHGEVRLLDPRRTILSDILPTMKEKEGPENNLMEKMQQQFNTSMGGKEKKVVFIFSHFIPCTESDNMCSAVIKEYVKRTDAYVIVAFEQLYKGTETNRALSNLSHENIYVLDRTYMRMLSFEINILSERMAMSVYMEVLRRRSSVFTGDYFPRVYRYAF